ncbi:MAG: Rpp14/Pop5 family protein [archaeon]
MNKKPFPPTMKEKNRYMIIKIRSNQEFTREQLIKEIWKSAFEKLGSLNIAKSSLRLMDFNREQQKGILRTNNKKQQEVRIMLTLIKNIQNKKAFISVEKVHGTLKKSRKQLKNN